MNNRKFILLLCLFVIITNLSKAQDVTESDAQMISNIFMSHMISSAKDASGEKDGILNCRISEISVRGKSNIYLIQYNEGGWVLVASNKKVQPILAYSFNGFFPEENNIPDNVINLLSFYEESIVEAANNINIIEIHDDWKKYERNNSETYSFDTNYSIILEKLGTNRWGQSKIVYNDNYYCNNHYNALCPIYPNVDYPRCNHSVVGCVALSMAQVMWYWEWPSYASVPDTVYQNGVWANPISYRDSYYNWILVPNELTISSSNSQWVETTQLLRDCGYSVKMNYGPMESTASSQSYLIPAMINNFGYSDNLQLVERSSYSSTEWINLLENEINYQRPIIYNGYLPAEIGGGHTFVIYGYDDTNHFYMNFGWNGVANGAYLLDNLIADGYDLTRNQQAFIGIEPNYCSVRKINPNEIWSSTFFKQYMGNIEISNRIIDNGMNGIISAGNSITLSNEFEINGANVEIYNEGTSCNDMSNRNNSSFYNAMNMMSINNRYKINFTEREFALFPNPVMDNLNIRLENNVSEVNVMIYNIEGVCVMQSHEKQIDVSSLPNGIYFVMVNTYHGNALKAKFIKE